LYAGLGGWADGLLAEGYDVVGFDLVRHEYGGERYPGHLVLQDVTTLHGAQFRDAALIVASPPCCEYSYMAMPWTRAKAKAAAIRADASGKMLAELNRLFDACFRIGGQASLAAGRHIPLIVENVRGAQPWVGRSRWHHGSYHLWGDVPALMPFTASGTKVDGSKRSFQEASVAATGLKGVGPKWDPVPAEGFKSHGMNWSDRTKRGQDFTRIAGDQAAGIKHRGSGAVWFDTGLASMSSSSPSRKAASAMIAKIPLRLARHIASIYREKGDFN
jgi:hypothetical protein